MRLAHFIQRYPPALGGAEVYFARLSEYCAAQGDTVTVFTSTAIDLEAFWKTGKAEIDSGRTQVRGVDVRRYPLWRWPGRRYVLKALSLWPNRCWQCLMQPCNPVSPAMWREVGNCDTKFDAVHATAFPYAFPIACAWRLARHQGLPFFVSPFLHLGDPDDLNDPTRRAYSAPHLRWLLREASGVFVQTPSEHRAVCGFGIPPDRVHLQGLGVDLRECTGGDGRAVRNAWNVGGSEVVVGHLANLSREKGTVDLLQALAPLSNLPLRVILAGPEMPNFRDYWDRQVATQPLANKVQRLGPLTERQKVDFFAGLDIFALPSRSDSFGLVLLEAWANGVPCVAWRAGGIADVIRHGIDGLLASCGNHAELTNHLRRLATDAALRARLGKAGQARLPSDFDWPSKLARVREVISEEVGK